MDNVGKINKIEEIKDLDLEPMFGEHLPVRNIEKELMETYLKTPLSEDAKYFQKKFIESRATDSVNGFGAYYKDEFRNDYEWGSIISYFVICPTNLGTSAALNLTSSNRTSKGCEALIRYENNNPPELWIYDWSLARPFMNLRLSFEALSDYFTTIQVGELHGQQAIYIQLTTSTNDGTNWSNLVGLTNYSALTVDLIYESQYIASTSIQKSGIVGSWGPILEPVQSSYTSMNFVGFRSIALAKKDSSEGWSTPTSLIKSQSNFVTDNTKLATIVFDYNSNYVFRAVPSV
ncbi:MAG: hypothetical protein LBT59_20535 [Clostridiales bacterium]|jgi:hypothetical protein|nr:hypothetical protein [Clostridiales bacterium]